MQYNVFLPDINNMKPVKNAQYKANLMSLNSFVMVRFLQDTMVQPIESEVPLFIHIVIQTHFKFVLVVWILQMGSGFGNCASPQVAALC